MRPVVKFEPQKYPLPDGGEIEIKASYTNYRDAKPTLVFNLGCFCSYCEDAYHQMRDLHVEHVQPKGLLKDGVEVYAHLTTEWSNFLLSCATCNGADNKDTKDVVLEECHLPHLNNTFKSLVYKAGGVVEVNSTLLGNALSHAENLLHLVGLHKSPATSCPGDRRWEKRRKDWDIACKYRTKYERGTADITTIVDLVRERGGWSIWFTVFEGIDEVRKALVQFPGTASECFDPENHYAPIDRNPGKNDPT